jgi:hypothetical protein
MSKALQKIETGLESTTVSALSVIERAAADKSVDVEKLERLFALQERLLARQAEEAFNAAMKEVQSQELRIIRDAQNPQTNSKYARLESLNKVIVPIYTTAGFSISFGTADCPVAAHYRITATVSHQGGHSRPYQCDIPIDDKGMKGTPNKTATHAFGSTMSYGRRYLTLLIFNIALVGEDDDKATSKPSTSGRVATATTLKWFLEQTQDITDKLQAYAIDKAIIMPDEGLDKWPLEKVPTSKTELSQLRREVEAHV